MLTCVTAGLPPHHLGLAVNVTCWVVNDFSTYGPVPTGLATAAVATLLSVENVCFGTMNVLPRMAKMFAYWAALKFRTRVCASGVETLLSAGTPLVLAAGLDLIVLNVNAASALVNGVPSLNFTPVRRLTVSVLPPLDQAYLVPSSGWMSPGLSALNSNSGSYSSDLASTWEANEFTSNGLKFLVKVTPVTASSVIEVVLAVLPDPDLPLCPLLEQAATPRPRIIAAAMPFTYL